MLDKSQLMRGTLEGCILKLISIKETYGYEIIENLTSKGFVNIKEGTIYPILIRLEKKEIITSQFKPSPLGPSRKYYSLTDEGIVLLKSFEDSWRDISNIVEEILDME